MKSIKYVLGYNLRGFTLAEVLITLGIIGVVAAMTIPTILQNIQNQENIVSLKKNYSVLTQAFEQAVQDKGSVDNWDLSSSTNFTNNLLPYFKFVKNCGTGSGCFAPQYKYPNNVADTDWSLDQDTNYVKIELLGGSSISFSSNGICNSTAEMSPFSNISMCGDIEMDINGQKSPNIYGVDLFYFYISQNGTIYPSGLKNDDWYDFDSACKDKNSPEGGWGCTAWVLYNQNMDYLKCNNLSWDGPKTCN